MLAVKAYVLTPYVLENSGLCCNCRHGVFRALPTGNTFFRGKNYEEKNFIIVIVFDFHSK